MVTEVIAIKVAQEDAKAQKKAEARAKWEQEATETLENFR